MINNAQNYNVPTGVNESWYKKAVLEFFSGRQPLTEAQLMEYTEKVFLGCIRDLTISDADEGEMTYSYTPLPDFESGGEDELLGLDPKQWPE